MVTGTEKEWRVVAVYLAHKIREQWMPPIPSIVYLRNKNTDNKNNMNPQGRKKGRGNFSINKLNSMLDTMEAVLPIGSEEWQEVVDLHDHNFPSTGRDLNSI